jgi:DeoR/GlpR family transcriptional regulator of sugar metabolism
MIKKTFVEERRKKILDYVKNNGRANVFELARDLEVTDVTIRRDLLLLENEGLIHRTHGGVIRRDSPALWQTVRLEERVIARGEEKDRIAQFISHIVNDNESIMIDGGSTTTAVAKELVNKKNLLVVTNAPEIGLMFRRGAENKVLLTGGEIMWGTYTLIGPDAEFTLRRIRTNKAIIGMSAIHPEEGLFSTNPEEGEIKRLMIMNSHEVIVAADSSKIYARALYMVCGFDRPFKIVTDKNICKDAMSRLRERGIEVFTV